MKDYARRSSRPATQESNSDGKGVLALFIFFVILFIGYAGYYFTHETLSIEKEKSVVPIAVHAQPKVIEKHKEKVIPLKLETHKKPVETVIETKKTKEEAHAKMVAKTKEITPPNPADVQPKYDFYRLLPETKVTILQEDDSTSTPN